MSAPPPPPSTTMRVAVVGAGAAGTAAARRLATLGAHVTLFDQAEGGPGGRASARPVSRTIPGRADHGAQFLRDDGACADLTALLTSLATSGHAAPWVGGRFGRVTVGQGGAAGGFSPGGGGASTTAPSFFGLIAPTPATLWVGTPHADGLAIGLATHPRLSPRWGARVSGVEARPDGRWGVTVAGEEKGEGGSAGGGAAAAPPSSFFDGVILADASVGRPSAPGRVAVSGGTPAASAAAGLLARVGAASARTPLFSVCALLPAPGARAPFDAADVEGSASVAVLVRDSAKPGRRPAAGGGEEAEAWVAVSSEAAAIRLLASAPLAGGRPPPDALAAAAEQLWAAAEEALVAAAGPGAPRPPPPLALRAQRWGAGLETGVWAGEGAPPSPRHFPRCATDPGAPGLAVCGDLFHAGDGAGLAAAVRSGVAAADAVGRR